MDNPPTIRAATLQDLATIVEFNQRLAHETENRRLQPDVLRAGVEHALRHADVARYFVAAWDGETVGQMMLTYEWSDWRNGLFWWIQSVYVQSEFRSRGVFRRLYQHVAELASSTPGVCGLRLYVEAHNSAALATYHKMGMQPSGHLVYEVDWSHAVSPATAAENEPLE